MNSNSIFEIGFYLMNDGKSYDKKERHLSLDEVQYFERAMDTFAEIKTSQEAADFFQTINDELKNKEILIAKHKTCSRFLDEYIKQCPNESLERLFRVFSTHFEDLSRDRFASHNVENLINQALQRLESGDQDTSFIELLTSFVSELTPCAANLADDPSGTHVIRCIFNSMSKLQNEKLTTKIDKLARKIIQSFVQDKSRIQSTYLSATVQCISSLDQEKYGKLLKYLLNSVPLKFENLSDKFSSRLIESLIENMGKSATTAIYEQTFANKENLPTGSLGFAVDCAFDQNANFVLQKWLENCRDPEQLMTVIKQLMKRVESLLSRRPQVIVSLSVGIVSTNYKLQKEFYDILSKQSNDGVSNENFVEHYYKFRPPNGSKILQNICYFDKKICSELAGEVLKLGGEKLADVAADKAGSYFVSDFIRSDNIDLKIRKKIIRRLFPKIGFLSTNQYGRHVVDNAFNIADLQLKKEICDNIVKAAKGDGSSSNMAAFKEEARTIWRNLRLDQFMSKIDLWEKDTENIMKRQQAMNEIINDESIPDVKPLAPKILNVQEEIKNIIQSPEAKQAAEEVEQIGSLHKRRKKHRHQRNDDDTNEQTPNDN